MAMVEIEYKDGTRALWGSVPDELAEQIEELIGQPDTLQC